MTFSTIPPQFIRLHAPRAPKCFDARDIWLEYLIAAQADKEKGVGTKPFLADGTLNPAFSFCQDCLPAHERQRRAEGRCVRPIRIYRNERSNATVA